MGFKFNPLTGQFDLVNASLTNPLLFKGNISVNTEFPLIADVQTGWLYTISASVTDNAGVTYTNTGQSFVSGDEIAWNGTNWSLLGNNSQNLRLDQTTPQSVINGLPNFTLGINTSFSQLKYATVPSWIGVTDIDAFSVFPVSSVPNTRFNFIYSDVLYYDDVDGFARTPTYLQVIRNGVDGTAHIGVMGENEIGGFIDLFKPSSHYVPYFYLRPTSGLHLNAPADFLGTVKLSNYTTNGFVKTNSSTGTLGVDTNTYINTSALVTSVGSPGLDTNVPSEKAVRSAISAGGYGDVSGPSSSVNNNVVFFDGVTGKLLKDSGLTLSGSNTGDQVLKDDFGISLITPQTTGLKNRRTVKDAGDIESFAVVTSNGNPASISFDVKVSGSSIIGAGNKPTLSSQSSINANVSGWTTTSFSANTIFEFWIDSLTPMVDGVSLILNYRKV